MRQKTHGEVKSEQHVLKTCDRRAWSCQGVERNKDKKVDSERVDLTLHLEGDDSAYKEEDIPDRGYSLCRHMRTTIVHYDLQRGWYGQCRARSKVVELERAPCVMMKHVGPHSVEN